MNNTINLDRRDMLFKCLILFTTIMLLTGMCNEASASMTNTQEMLTKEGCEDRIDNLVAPLAQAEEDPVFFKWDNLVNDLDCIGSITYGAGKFVITSARDVYIVTKARDGLWKLTAKQRVAKYTGIFINIMLYAEGKFIGSWNCGDEHKLMYSSDGIDWNIISFCFDNSPIRAIAHGNGIRAIAHGNGIMAIAHGNGMYVVATGSSLFYGKTLSSLVRCSKDFDFVPFGVKFGNNMFVSIDNQFDHKMQAAYSNNGIDWMLGNFPDINGLLSAPVSIAFGNNRFVAINKSSNIFYTTDGINWDIRDVPQKGSDVLFSVIYANGIFIASASQGCFYSLDAIDWRKVTYPNGNIFLWTRIAYGDGAVMIGGENKAIAFYPYLKKDNPEDSNT